MTGQPTEIKDMFHYIRAQSTHSEWAAIMLNLSSAELLNAISLLYLIIFGRTVGNGIYTLVTPLG